LQKQQKLAKKKRSTDENQNPSLSDTATPNINKTTKTQLGERKFYD